MTRKRRRLLLLLVCLIGLGSATGLSLMAFRQNLVFFLSPSEVASKEPPAGRAFRLGGLVANGSVTRGIAKDGEPSANFSVTDGKATLPVTYEGVLPDLFREGQGVVALGSLQNNGTFKATEVLARHDENYMPPEVEAALKKAGHWDPKKGEPPPSSSWNTLEPTAAADTDQKGS